MSALTTLYLSEGGDMQKTEPVGTIMFDVVSCDLIETTVTVGDSVTMYDGVRITPSAFCAP